MRLPLILIAATALTAPIFAGCATQQENPNYQFSSRYKGEGAQNVHAASYQTATTYAANSARTDCDNRETTRGLIGAGVGGTVGAIAGKKLVGGTEGALLGAAVGGTAGYGIADKTIDCDAYGYETDGRAVAYESAPAPTTVSQPYAPATYGAAPVSPTEEAYQAETMTGTPGYAIVEVPDAPQTAPSMPSAPISAAPVPAAPGPAAPMMTTPQATAPMMGTGPREIEYDYGQNVIIADAETQIPQSETRIISSQGYAGYPSVGVQAYTVQPGDTVYSLSRRLCVGLGEVTAPNGIGSDYAIAIGQQITLPASRC